MQINSPRFLLITGFLLILICFITLLAIISLRIYIDIPFLLIIYAISLVGLIIALYGIYMNVIIRRSTINSV
ncbi:hypothetical protein Igag_0956 [Ignisphaera aggregans DSM 17230]|uniref:Uncharacterized protein n=1 Tax=Ignisphaera aggregans (strain DSM 17230 / JCM 13409 / AQ1.S1) TaxID=583356 RepID=E0SNH5_IGNAA|nr:hypothetical protein Igag_0956 [Ignisphaera aggregans DSM 17230]